MFAAGEKVHEAPAQTTVEAAVDDRVHGAVRVSQEIRRVLDLFKRCFISLERHAVF